MQGSSQASTLDADDHYGVRLSARMPSIVAPGYRGFLRVTRPFATLKYWKIKVIMSMVTGLHGFPGDIGEFVLGHCATDFVLSFSPYLPVKPL
jgi:hypothetical protein